MKKKNSMSNNKVTMQRAWEYVSYMMLTSYFGKSSCTTPLWEKRLKLYYEDLKIKDQYLLEDKCLEIVEDRIKNCLPESFFKHEVQVKLTCAGENKISTLHFICGNEEFFYYTIYKAVPGYECWYLKDEKVKNHLRYNGKYSKTVRGAGPAPAVSMCLVADVWNVKEREGFPVDDDTIVFVSGETTEKGVNAILLALLKQYKEHMRFLASFGKDTEKQENKEATIREDLEEIIEYMKSKEIGGVLGGICFENKDYTIFPQCCCDLSGWRNVIEGMRQHYSAWMGHDPYPVCTFEGDKIAVNLLEDSEDRRIAWLSRRQRERRGIPFVEYRECDLEYFYGKLRNDMYEFTYGPLRKRISELLPGREDEFCQGWWKGFGGW